MPIAVIETRTDAHAAALQSAADGYSKKFDKGSVRRPLRGIEIKEDTYASIQVITASGDNIPLVDAGGSSGPNQYKPTGANAQIPSRAPRAPSNVATSTIYSNFIIQSITDSRQEKAQFMETFGDTYVFFFGERPRVLTVTGLLFNTLDFNWRSEFWYNYENFLRGTKLVENNARIYLHWDDIVVEGYMMGAEAQDNADLPYHIPFSFQLFVTNHSYLYPLYATGGIGDPYYPKRYDASMAEVEATFNVANTRALANASDANAAWYRDMVNIAKNTATSAGLLGTAASINTMLGKGNGVQLNSNLMKALLTTGVISQATTFLTVIKNYFRAENIMIRPKSNTRTKIRDNQDEYIGSNFVYQFDEAAIKRTEAIQAAYKTFYEVEGAAIYALNAMSYDPVLQGDSSGVSPLSQQHRFQIAGVLAAPLIPGL